TRDRSIAAVVGATPGRANKSARGAVGERRARRQGRFERLERRADVVAQRFKPRSRACLASVEQALAHRTSVLRLGHGGPAVTIAPCDAIAQTWVDLKRHACSELA